MHGVCQFIGLGLRAHQSLVSFVTKYLVRAFVGKARVNVTFSDILVVTQRGVIFIRGPTSSVDSRQLLRSDLSHLSYLKSLDYAILSCMVTLIGTSATTVHTSGR